MEGREGVVRVVIDKGADASAARNDGKTPLNWVSMMCHSRVVRLLIDKGADASAAKNDRETLLASLPLLWARSPNRPQL